MFWWPETKKLFNGYFITVVCFYCVLWHKHLRCRCMQPLWKCPLIPPKGSWPTGWELLTWSFSITLSCWPLSVSFQMDRKTSKMSLQQAWSWWTPASALCRSQEYSTRRITPQVKVGWTEAPSGCRVLASLFFLKAVSWGSDCLLTHYVWSQRGPWTFDPNSSISGMLGLQTCVSTHCNGKFILGGLSTNWATSPALATL